ncbi:MAG: response regulator transcription factor [Gammaproteobacteria bacterium]|nr:response regulator transcription factor [Gammaproteobacteria bacterium]MDH5694726.1 response regulator transcription factor [Gammaproteobacteria bacterium]
MRALIIEDEPELREQLAEALRKQGYAVDVAADGEEGHFLGCEYDYDIAIVDIGLPKLTGLEVIQKWRNTSRRFPILILTARDRWQEKVEGLEAGADDYLVKPFHQEELLARLKALVRRATGQVNNTIQCGPISIDTYAQTVSLEGNQVDFTAYEYNTLEYLVVHRPKVISKTELVEHLYDQDYDRDSNVIEVFINRLRKKLDPSGTLNPIETLRGRGYRFTLDCEQ